MYLDDFGDKEEVDALLKNAESNLADFVNHPRSQIIGYVSVNWRGEERNIDGEDKRGQMSNLLTSYICSRKTRS